MIAALCGITYLATLHYGTLVMLTLRDGKHEVSMVNVEGQAEVVFSHKHTHDHAKDHEGHDHDHDHDAVGAAHYEDHHHGDHVLKLLLGEKSTLTNEWKLRAPVMMPVLCPAWMADTARPAIKVPGLMRVMPPPLLKGPAVCLRTTVLVI